MCAELTRQPGASCESRFYASDRGTLPGRCNSLHIVRGHGFVFVAGDGKDSTLYNRLCLLPFLTATPIHVLNSLGTLC